MKTSIWSCLIATVFFLAACGGGGGRSGECSGSVEYCAEFASTDGASSSGTTGGTTQAGLFSKTGTGDTVFEIPANVTKIRIQGSFSGTSSNFIVHIAGRGVVNEIIGTGHDPVNFEGTYLLTGGGAVEITSSSGVSWSFTEVPPENVIAPGGYFTKSGTGDTVFDLPSRVTKIRIQGSYSGTSSNFIVRIAGKGVVNEIIGASKFPVAYDGISSIAAGGTVEITSSSGVSWTFTELP